MTDVGVKEAFELDDSKNILSPDRYLHEAIEIWLHILITSIKEGHQNALEVGLIAQSISANKVIGIANSKGLVHWIKKDLPGSTDKRYDKIIRHNHEAEEYQGKLKEFKAILDTAEIGDKKIYEGRVADFNVFEILKAVEKNKTKQGKVII